MKYFLPIVTLLVTYYPSHFKIKARIVKVLDGDTVEIQRGSSERFERVRLVYIDAPESLQIPWGKRATLYLEKSILGKTVSIDIVGRGYYGRLLGEIYLNNQSVNLSLLSKGLVFLYPWSKFTSLKQKSTYQQTSELVKDRKVGVWREKVMLPWKYRRKRKKRRH